MTSLNCIQPHINPALVFPSERKLADLLTCNVLLFLAANSVGQIQDNEKVFSKQLASMSLSIGCIHQKLKSQICYDNVLLAMFSTEKSSSHGGIYPIF